MASQKHSFRRDKAISMLVIIGLVFQAMMAAVMLPMPLTGSSALAAERADAGGLSSSYIICTPEGLKRISLDENGNPVEEPLSSGGCAVCNALAASTFALPAMDIVAPVNCADTDVAFPGAEFRYVSVAHGIQNNRGPPCLA
jgi:hypothetical protein